MTELIEINVKNFNDEELNSVNARDLHHFLSINKKFSDWIKVQIYRGMFEENSDFIAFPQKGNGEIKKNSRGVWINEKGQSVLIDYYLTLDTAKEISMMSGTSKGKEVRNYFIKVEKEFFKMQEQLNNQTNIKKSYVNLSDTKIREAFFIDFDNFYKLSFLDDLLKRLLHLPMK